MIRVVMLSLLSFLSLPLRGVVKGSEVAVSVQPSVTFPASDSDNTILGFGWFKNGFTLEDSITTCTFDGAFPVSGTIALNGGTLHLLQDLLFHNPTTIQSLGTIMGNGREIQLSKSITQFPADNYTFNNVDLIFNSDMAITGTICFQGDCTIKGHGSVITLESDASIQIDSDAKLSMRGVEVHGVKGESVQCVDDTGSLVLYNTRWIQDGSVSWKKGSILFQEYVSFLGSSTFAYTSLQTSTIAPFSELRITDGFMYGEH